MFYSFVDYVVCEIYCVVIEEEEYFMSWLLFIVS